MFEKYQQFKNWFLAREGDLFTIFMVVLACFLSYGLGRLSKVEEYRTPVSITMPTSSPSIRQVSAVSAVATDGRIVASKNGTKYYFPWCGGQKNIKAENKIYFNTEGEAKSAGYSLAANCSAKP